MEFAKKTIKFARDSNGIPALWESLKKFPTMERITYIFDNNGDSIEPIFNRLGTNSSLIPIRENFLILKLFFDNEGCGISLSRIISIDKYSNTSEVEVLKRKPSGSDIWYSNESSELDITVYEKISNVVENILDSVKNI